MKKKYKIIPLNTGYIQLNVYFYYFLTKSTKKLVDTIQKSGEKTRYFYDIDN